MESSTRLGIGIAALAAGLGGGGYLLSEYAKSSAARQLTVGVPNPLTATLGQVQTVPVSIKNPGSKAVTVGVEGALYAPPALVPTYFTTVGAVEGHFWTNTSALAQALNDAQSGDAAAYQLLQLSPSARVATAQIAAGGQATLNLYVEPTVPGSLPCVLWIGVSPTGLIVNDTLGKAVPGTPSGVVAYRLTLQVS